MKIMAISKYVILLLPIIILFNNCSGGFRNLSDFGNTGSGSTDNSSQSDLPEPSYPPPAPGSLYPQSFSPKQFLKPHDGILSGEIYGPTYSTNFTDFRIGRQFIGSEGSGGFHYNQGVRLRWKNQGGDWQNDSGNSQALVSSSRIVMNQVDTVYQVDVTNYVKSWASGFLHNSGFMLIGDTSSSNNWCELAGRVQPTDLADHPQGPRLNVVYSDGETLDVPASATTTIQYGTYSTLGNRNLSISASTAPQSRVNSLIFFDQTFNTSKTIQSAFLKVTPKVINSSGSCKVFVMATVNPGELPPYKDRFNTLSAKYPGDQNLKSDPDVISYLVPDTDFFDVKNYNKISWSTAYHKTEKWKLHTAFLSDGSRAKDFAVIDNTYSGLGFRPVKGIDRWFKVTYPGVPQGATQPADGPLNGLLDIYLTFADDAYPELVHPKASTELDELYISSLVQFGTDADLNCGGKIGPAVFGINGRLALDLKNDGQLVNVNGSGNGGTPSTGDGGWSSRFSYAISQVYNPRIYSVLRPKGNPVDQFLAGTTYIYHKNQTSVFGDITPDSNDGRQIMQIGKTYQLEMRVKMNDAPEVYGAGVPKANGIVQQWLNDQILEDRQDLLFRNQNHSRFYRRGANWSDIANLGAGDVVDEIADYKKGRNAIRSAGIEVYYGGNCINRKPITVFVSRIVVAKKPIGRYVVPTD